VSYDFYNCFYLSFTFTLTNSTKPISCFNNVVGPVVKFWQHHHGILGRIRFHDGGVHLNIPGTKDESSVIMEYWSAVLL